MKWIAVLCLAVALPASGQTTVTTHPVSPQTFRSPDGKSEFIYPSDYTLYTGSATAQPGWPGSSVCQSGIACVVYPPSRYAGTNFEAASFEEREIDATTKGACLTSPMRSKDYPEFSTTKDPRKIIHGVRFLHGVSGDAAASQQMVTDLYRAFHKQRCYELSINIATESFGSFDPGTIKEFTREDERRVRDELTAILDSFRFLK